LWVSIALKLGRLNERRRLVAYLSDRIIIARKTFSAMRSVSSSAEKREDNSTDCSQGSQADPNANPSLRAGA
jgi:hypothetical protein